MLQKGKVMLREGHTIPLKANVGPPKAKWHAPRVNECEVMCLLTPSHANHLRNQTIHQTLTRKMTSKARG
jgi:hypothetical protein